MIKIICVGKLKEKYLVDACLEYTKRISKYTKIENLIQYINFIRETAEKLNFDWSFFCFVNNDFGIFELQNKTWNKPLLKALIPDAPALRS